MRILRRANVESDHPEMVASLVGLGVNPSAVNILTATNSRPRHVSFADGEVIVMRGINKQDPDQPDDMISLRLYLNAGLVLSAMRKVRRLESIGDVIQQLNDGRTLSSSSELVVLLIERITFKIRQFVEALDEALEGIESGESAEASEQGSFCETLTVIRRRSASVKRYLTPQRAALESLHAAWAQRAPDSQVKVHELINMTLLNTEDLELCRERAIVMQDDYRHDITDRQSQRLYMLSLITAIFLPLSFLTGVFGMNVAGLPGTQDMNAFKWLCGGMGGVALVVTILMRRHKWM